MKKIKKVQLPPDDRNVFDLIYGYFSTISIGLLHTIGRLFEQLFGKRQSDTLEWPEVPATYGPRFRGKHFLTKRPDGQVRCTACYMCSTACPADCITIVAGEHTDKTIEKFPVRFEIDMLRCVYCGYCEEACPVDAIRLGPEYSIAAYSRDELIYGKDYLLNRPELTEDIHSIKEENTRYPQNQQNNPYGPQTVTYITNHSV